MRIGTLAQHLGTTPHAVRFYERHGLLPPPERTENGYREYSEADVERLRLLIGLRQLDLPLGQSAQVAALCAEGRCEQVSVELRSVLAASTTCAIWTGISPTSKVIWRPGNRRGT